MAEAKTKEAPAGDKAKTEVVYDSKHEEATFKELQGIGFDFDFIDKSTSQCLADDIACRKKEDAAAAAEALRQKKLNAGKYKPPELKIKKDSTGKLVCTMDGFTKMITELTEVSLALLAMAKEACIGMIPDNFKRAIKFAWNATVGVGNWVGYLVAATYFISEEFDFGQTTCDIFGYGYWLVDQLYVLVDLVDKGAKTEQDISKVASAAAKERAAKASLRVMKDAKRVEAFKNMAVIEKSIADGSVGTPDFLGKVRGRIVATYDAKSAATAKAAAAHKKAMDEAAAAKPAAETTPAKTDTKAGETKTDPKAGETKTDPKAGETKTDPKAGTDAKK